MFWDSAQISPQNLMEKEDQVATLAQVSRWRRGAMGKTGKKADSAIPSVCRVVVLALVPSAIFYCSRSVPLVLASGLVSAVGAFVEVAPPWAGPVGVARARLRKAIPRVFARLGLWVAAALLSAALIAWVESLSTPAEQMPWSGVALAAGATNVAAGASAAAGGAHKE